MTWAQHMAEEHGDWLARYIMPRAEDFRDDEMAYKFARLAGHFGRIALQESSRPYWCNFCQDRFGNPDCPHCRMRGVLYDDEATNRWSLA